MRQPPLLITGIPGSGKSTFARHLRDEHGYFIFIPEEPLSDPASAEVRLLLDKAFATGDASRLVKKLRNLPRNSAVEWGFPADAKRLAHSLAVVRSMKANGTRVVWFECPDDVARKRFVERGTVKEELFDIQTPAIREHYDTIMAEVEPDVVDVLRDDGSDKSPDELFAEIFGRGLPRFSVA